ncbi:hypothetical protein DFJ73DRAFT_629447 [Zopfochytrium polystomum]|nr:hypothetical protein DFJ73DRAFT_629447 [Zopfochytrium polystomum]
MTDGYHANRFRRHRLRRQARTVVAAVVAAAIVVVQGPSAAMAQCLSLTGSTSCSDWSSYQVYYSGAGSSPFDNSVSSFDAYIASQVDTKQSSIDLFKATYDCPGFTGVGLRYHITTLCGLYVDTAYINNQCNNGVAPSKSTCTTSAKAFIQSAQTLFSTASICNQNPSADVVNQRTSLATTVNLLVTHMGDNAANCVAAATGSAENSNCGYYDNAAAIAHCNELSSDACCANVAGFTPSSTLSSTSSATSSSGSSSANAATASSSSSPKTTTTASPAAASAVGSNVSGGGGGGGNVIPLPPGLSSLGGGLMDGANGGNGGASVMSETMEVVFNYVPNLSDEIYLYVGDPVIVKCKFDDGWGFGFNMTTKMEGSFPLACVAPYVNESDVAGGGGGSTPPGATRNEWIDGAGSRIERASFQIRQRGSSIFGPPSGFNGFADGTGLGGGATAAGSDAGAYRASQFTLATEDGGGSSSSSGAGGYKQ